LDSVIIPPCFIGENVLIENSVVGPHVSIGNGTHIQNSVISNSNIQLHSTLQNVVLSNSMVGSHANYVGSTRDLSLGDYSTILE
jgi:glucose-1-phosphate thymidylyltransferase